MQSWIFHAGATSCLVGNYLTASGRDVKMDLQMVKDLGLEVVREL
jgi:biotin synthase-like enzyme